jgi:hypothetical protein
MPRRGWAQGAKAMKLDTRLRLLTTKIIVMGKHQLPPGVSAEIISKIARVSLPLVYRKLNRGMAPDEIIAQAVLWREKRQMRDELNLPPIPIDDVIGANGHSKNGYGTLNFAQAQTAKENALAELRQLEVLEKRGELVPATYVRQWALTFVIEGKQILQYGPAEMRDALAAESDPHEVEAILARWVERVLDCFHRTESLWIWPPRDGGCAPVSPQS